MKYYKKLNSDGSVEMIGTSETITEGIEITEDEYQELHETIKTNAVHIVIDETTEDK